MRPRPIPRKTAGGVGAQVGLTGASMRPRPIPRKTWPRGRTWSTRWPRFNEAAADTAENAGLTAPGGGQVTGRFNEAAADTAENAGRRIKLAVRRASGFNEAAADTAENGEAPGQRAAAAAELQ